MNKEKLQKLLEAIKKSNDQDLINSGGIIETRKLQLQQILEAILED